MAAHRSPRIVLLLRVRPQTEGDAMALLPPALKSSLLTARPSTRLPPVFVDVASWPSSPVNLFCWHCNGAVQNFVWFVPTAMEAGEGEKRIKSMRPRGCFCGIPCACAWNRKDALTDTEREMRERLLMRLVEIQQKLPLGSIKILHPAPDPHEALAEYGTGTQSREEYRRKLVALKILTLNIAPT